MLRGVLNRKRKEQAKEGRDTEEGRRREKKDEARRAATKGRERDRKNNKLRADQRYAEEVRRKKQTVSAVEEVGDQRQARSGR